MITPIEYPATSVCNTKAPVPNARQHGSLQRTKTHVKIRHARVPSTLEWFGVYQRDSIQYICSNNQTDQEPTPDVIVSRERELLVARGVLRFMLHWNRQQSYGRIPTSVHAYPVVDDLYTLFKHHMLETPFDEMRQIISSGNIHPFTRDSRGHSLLHVSLRTHRCHHGINA